MAVTAGWWSCFWPISYFYSCWCRRWLVVVLLLFCSRVIFLVIVIVIVVRWWKAALVTRRDSAAAIVPLDWLAAVPRFDKSQKTVEAPNLDKGTSFWLESLSFLACLSCYLLRSGASNINGASCRYRRTWLVWYRAAVRSLSEHGQSCSRLDNVVLRFESFSSSSSAAEKHRFERQWRELLPPRHHRCVLMMPQRRGGLLRVTLCIRVILVYGTTGGTNWKLSHWLGKLSHCVALPLVGPTLD